MAFMGLLWDENDKSLPDALNPTERPRLIFSGTSSSGIFSFLGLKEE